eukprot:5472323-Pyramimonas_sp.AAC.1
MRPCAAAHRLLRRGFRRLPQGRCAAAHRRPAGQWGWGCLGEDRGPAPTLVSSFSSSSTTSYITCYFRHARCWAAGFEPQRGPRLAWPKAGPNN